MKKYRILCVVLALVMVLVLAGCGETAKPAEEAPAAAAATFKGKDIAKEELKIAFIPLGASGEQMIPTIEAYDFALSSYPNISYQIFDSQFDVTRQLEFMNECITQGVDGIILQCADANALNNVIVEAEEAGIPVITQNLGCTGVRTAHVMNGDYTAGWAAAKYFDEHNAIPKDGKVIILDVVAEIKPVCRMGTAFHDYAVQNTSWTILDEQPVENTSQENANTIMRDLLTKYDHIDAVYCVNDACAVGAMQAIEAAGRSGEGIKLWGFEGNPAVLQAIKDGTIYGTSFCDQYTTSCELMNLMLFLISTGITGQLAGYESEADVPFIEMNTIPTTPENVDLIIARSHYD